MHLAPPPAQPDNRSPAERLIEQLTTTCGVLRYDSTIHTDDDVRQMTRYAQEVIARAHRHNSHAPDQPIRIMQTAPWLGDSPADLRRLLVEQSMPAATPHDA